MTPIRVLLADDHRIVLEGLAQLLSLEPDIKVVLRCTDGTEAYEAVQTMNPDILVADVKMPGLTGLQLLRRLTEESSTTRVILLTAHMTDDEVLAALRSGVGGIILKESAPRALVQCVRAVAAGQQWIDQRTVQIAIEKLLQKQSREVGSARSLTRRELEIVRMVATGLRNRQIGESLGISEGTVKMHLHSIYEKVGVNGRVELSIYAREKALL